MNQNTHDMHFPDHESVPSAMVFTECWDSEAVYELIRSKCGYGVTPAFLLLGRKEASLLKSHLAKAFGEEAVSTLNGTHYMGLEVVEMQCESFVATNGRKINRTLQDPLSRRPTWCDRDAEGLWQFRI